MAQLLDMAAVDKALEGFTIPPRPELLVQLQAEIDKDEPEIKAIAQLISQDIGISGFTLKVVNSPAFALTRKINSIEHACMFLGIIKVVKLVNSVALRFAMSGEEPDQFSELLWNTSTDIANSCMALGHYFGFDFVDEAYTVGMFHNAGKALIYAQREDYPEQLAAAYRQDEMSITEFEEQEFSSSHEVLGFLIAQHWGLSSEISNVIAYHHSCQTMISTGSPQEKQMFAILKLSEHMINLPAKIAKADQEFEWDKYKHQILDILEIEDFQLLDIGEMLFAFGINNNYHR